uniref:Phosphatidic acid phosphatase type 2/haloperoxidase domain-containing protein n=1 Tax=Stomoxys calcitrans TaxID=35570 RepID=A0A1I8PM43_STOCA
MSTCSSTRPDTTQLVENRKLLHRLILDLLIIIVLLIPVVLCEFVIEPFRRGFFCDDETIRYPYKDNTVTPVILGVLLSVPPLIVLAIGEYARQYKKGAVSSRRYLWGCQIPIWWTNLFRQFVYFCFGLLLTFDATEVGKYTIGRLRPHFMEVCQPQFADGSTCRDSFNQHRYVENYFCLGTGYTAADVRQARLSFPSGHSSLVFYAMLYISMYLQKRMHWRRSDLTRHFIQFTLVMIAWFTALTRVMDNWHHWSDVLCGSIIGVMGALITANYISKLFKKSHADLSSLRISGGLIRQDTSATLNEVLANTPPPYTIESQAAATAFTNEQYCTKV